MIKYLIEIDHKWFSIINSWHSEALDATVIFISDKSWYIVLGLILVASILKLKSKFYHILIMIGLAWGLADLVSTRVFKDNFKRLRPCHSMRHQDAYKPANYSCGGQYGFVSSHAANSTAIVTIVLVAFGSYYRFLTIPWLVLVCYSRIYLARHYPADLLGGVLVGILCGLFVWKMIMLLLKKYELE